MMVKKAKCSNATKYFMLQFEIALLGSDQLGAVICETWRHRYVVVDAVLEGSVAERVGLRINDRIVQVNAIRSPTLHTIGELFKQGQPVRLTIYRKHTERTLKMMAQQGQLKCVECDYSRLNCTESANLNPIPEVMVNSENDPNPCPSDALHQCRWRTWSQFLRNDDNENRHRERYCITAHNLTPQDNDQECVDHNNDTPTQSTPVKNATFVKESSFQRNKENYKPLQDSASLHKVHISPKTAMFNKVYFAHTPDNRGKDLICWEEKVRRVLKKLPNHTNQQVSSS